MTAGAVPVLVALAGRARRRQLRGAQELKLLAVI